MASPLSEQLVEQSILLVSEYLEMFCPKSKSEERKVISGNKVTMPYMLTACHLDIKKNTN